MGATSEPDELDGQPADHGWRLWLLARANRWLVTAAVLAAVFISMVALGVANPSPLQEAIAASDPIDTLFQAFVGAIITGVTLVVTINQLVLSQELGPLGDQRSRMEGAMAFRSDVEDATAVGVSPNDPGEFLAALVAATGTHADAVADAVQNADPDVRREIEEYVSTLNDEVDSVQDRLADAQFGTFDVVWEALDFTYSDRIYEGRRLRTVYGDDLSAEAQNAIDDLVEILAFFGPAREHFKTLYFQWELINLSRAILYSAIPALVVAAAMIVYFDAQAVPGVTLGLSNDVLVVSAATTVSVVPFVLLLSWVLRVATVAKLTLAMGPFVLQER